jgi:TP53 regulating kinase-like protein
MKLIATGAEAEILQDGNSIVKKRIKKSYRLPEIDIKLRKFRTRREAKLIEDLNRINFPSPKLLELSEKNNEIKMEFLKGKLLKNILNKNNCAKLCKELGEKIGALHKNNIIHGDLTTSNMIYFKNKIYFIDFGLSFYSAKIEDKAVDLHLCKQALQSKHSKIWEKCFKAVMQGYNKVNTDSKLIYDRLNIVEQRGRYKKKSLGS